MKGTPVAHPDPGIKKGGTSGHPLHRSTGNHGIPHSPIRFRDQVKNWGVQGYAKGNTHILGSVKFTTVTLPGSTIAFV